MVQNEIVEVNNLVKEILGAPEKSVKEILQRETQSRYFKTELLIDNFKIHIYYEHSEAEPLTEADHRFKPLGKQYFARLDKSINMGKDHLHLFKKGKQLAVMNIDGTGSHGFSGYKLNNKIIAGIKKEFPDVIIPSNGILESISKSTELMIKFSDLI